MSTGNILLDLPGLPFWRGVETQPGTIETLPFRLAWDPAGFVRQATDTAILERVIAEYADDNYRHMTGPPGHSAWATRLGEMRIDFARDMLGDIAGFRVLEIGGGSYYTAKRMVGDFGVSEYRVMDPALPEEPSLPPGVHGERGYFSRERAGEFSVDLVFGFHVFEHVNDPLGFLAAARRALEGGNGRILLSVPDCESDFVSGVLDPYVHEHMNFFTDAMARTIFAQAGISVVASQAEHGVLSYVLAPDGPKCGPSNVPVPDGLAQLSGRIATFVEHVGRSFEAALAEHRQIAVHGATAGVNSLFHLLGAAYADRVVPFDGNEATVGCYLPSLPTAIRASNDGSYTKMGCVFIAVAGYFDEIKAFLVNHHGIDSGRIHPLTGPSS